MTDYAKTLQNAREQMVKARREAAEELARPYSDTPRSRTIFVEIQNVIEQIDKAIAEEQRLAPPRPKRFSPDDRYSEEHPTTCQSS
jgi:hypothetical protein